MAGFDVFTVMVFAAVSLVSAVLALALTGRFLPPGWRGDGIRAGRARGPVVADVPRRYEFRESYLLSPVDPNDAFLDAQIDRSRAFEALCDTLSGMHPDFDDRVRALTERGEAFALTGEFGGDAMALSGCFDDDQLILSVAPSDASVGREAVDSATLRALRKETVDLRDVLDHGPVAMWKLSPEGQILWANGPYFALAEALSDTAEPVTWPLPDLFGPVDPALADDIGQPRRVVLTPKRSDGTAPLQDGAAQSFEVSRHRQDDGTVICAALPINRLVAAETALQSFIQTLSQTFAHLPIGLAVFDKQRELVLFNPALTTITRLDIQMLSRRPTLVAFLDGLRDGNRIPEPRNYRGWRDQIARLEQGAEDGSYHELWTLPCGQTLRVIGRPHPDGAVAFMFEDISSEVSLTRKFRGDLDLYQSVLDDVPGALAVFANDGRMVLQNAAHAELWGADPESGAGVMLGDQLARWSEACDPAPVWQEIRQFSNRSTSRQKWQAPVIHRDGHAMICHVAPLAGAAMLVRFVPADGATPRDTDTAAHIAPVAKKVAAGRRAAFEAAEPPAVFAAHAAARRQAE
jgi:PAS domain-containing protein